MNPHYEALRRALGLLQDAPGFLPDAVPPSLLDELVAEATGPTPGRFPDPPWRVVAIVGEEREALVSQVAEALARHWGLGSLGPRGLASDKVLGAPALVLVFSTVPSAEGAEAFGLVAGVVQNLVLLAHAAGLATHRIHSPHVVPEAVLDFVGERLGPELRRGELAAMLALGYPVPSVSPPERAGPGARPSWIGRADLPPVAVAPSTERMPRPAAVLRAERAERVHLVDPYPYNREHLASYLAAAGYDVRAHAQGEELLQSLDERDPELFVIAEMLPDMAGFELVRRLRAQLHLQAPIIVTTARRDSGFRIGGLTAGVDYYLRKPVNPVELYTAARLLLERHRLVSELRQATTFQETLLEAMSTVGVLALDANFRTVYASPGASRLTGFPREELVGRPPSFLAAAPADLRPPAGEGHVHEDVALRRSDGSVFDVELRRSTLRDARGSAAGYLTVFFDIGERTAMERALREKNQELGRLLDELRATQARLVQQGKMASLGQLVAGVAHEINTPLGAVVSNNDLFLRAFHRLDVAVRASGLGESEKLRRDLDAVTVLSEITRDACQRITGIVRTLRTFARLDEADVKAVDLHEGIESTLVLIAHLLKGGITVERRYAALPKVECHPNQINQVFMNLLVNACQAIEGGGRITIETSFVGDADTGMARVSIGDSGRGIPVEHLSRVFDPGFTTKGAGVGTGLGLSICYQIVEAHGGEITVDSASGRGATFTVTLPVRQPDAPPA